MFRTTGLFSLIVLGCLMPGQVRGEPNGPNKDALALQKAFQAAIAEAEPSVACILVSRSPRYKQLGAAPSPDRPGQLGDFSYNYGQFDPQNENDREKRRQILRLDLASGSTAPESYGSGVVIDDKERLVLTNYHVVLKATKVYVRLPGGRGSYANIYAADPRSDLAVLQLIKEVPLKAIKLGDADKVKKGQFVLGLANPYAAGFRDGSPSASWGIISNIRRLAPNSFRNELDNTRTLHQYGTLLQTDAKINLGCSGGALIDLDGRLIGLITALAAVNGTDTPGGFALPIDATMRRIIDTLGQGKEVEYSFLGVQFEDPILVEGVVLKGIVNNSPAFHAGLKPGDKIVALNNTPVKEIDDVVLPLARLAPGASARLGILRSMNRAPRKLTKTVVVGKFAVPGPIIAANRPEFRGIRVDYASLLVQKPYFHRDMPTGVLVCEVKSGTQAAEELKAGQVIIITRVNDRGVASPRDFYEAVKGLKGPVELDVTENGTQRKVKIN
jgi:S1-C subfamily serine protease